MKFNDLGKQLYEFIDEKMKNKDLKDTLIWSESIKYFFVYSINCTYNITNNKNMRQIQDIIINHQVLNVDPFQKLKKYETIIMKCFENAMHDIDEQTQEMIIEYFYSYFDLNFNLSGNLDFDLGNKQIKFAIYRLLSELYDLYGSNRNDFVVSNINRFNEELEKYNIYYDVEWISNNTHNKYHYDFCEQFIQLNNVRVVNDLDTIKIYMIVKKLYVEMATNKKSSKTPKTPKTPKIPKIPKIPTASVSSTLTTEKKTIAKTNRKKEIDNVNEMNDTDTQVKIKKYKKKTVPKALRMKLWTDTFGDTLVGKCECCKRELKVDNFEAGHIIAEVNGGETCVDNLKVLCRPCNASCGTDNLNDFIRKMNYKC
jgi:hypothetical protein